MQYSTLLKCLVGGLVLTSLITAQAETIEFKAKPGSKVVIKGDSTMHAWTVEGSLIGGSAKIGDGFPLEPGQSVNPGRIEATVEAKIPITSLRSVKDGKPYSTKMDEVMREKLGAPTEKFITYTLDELTLKESAADAASPYKFDSKGKLVVAGVTNDIALPVEVTLMEAGKVKFATAADLKMSDFKVEPPALTVLGIGIKTDDAVQVSIEWLTERSK